MNEELIRSVVIPSNNYSLLTVISESIIETTTLIFNELIDDVVDYVVSADIEDFLEIQLDPKLVKAIQEVDRLKNNTAIQNSYKVLDKILRKDGVATSNPLSKAYISGMVKSKQVEHVLSSRGIVTELDSTLYKIPITSSFTLGMKDMYEMAAESRSGAKAAYLSTVVIEKAEYFSREIQLGVMPVANLVYTDCGNDDYLDWLVMENDGKCDLKNMVGSYYLNEETGREEALREDMTHLIGKTIKLRNVINCKHPNKYSLCSRCLGEIAYSVPEFSNLGHLASTILNGLISQGVLSTKHHISSAVAKAITLARELEGILRIKDGNKYTLSPQIHKTKSIKMTMTIDRTECFGINDINRSKSIFTLDPTRVTRITNVKLTITNTRQNSERVVIIPVGNEKRPGHLDNMFLKYVIDNGYTIDDDDNYVINLENWRNLDVIMFVKESEYSFISLNNDVKSKFKKKLDKKNRETPESLISSLFTMVNSKLDVNIGLLSIIVSAFIMKSDENSDLGRVNKETRKVGNLGSVILGRSLGGAYGWEMFINNITDPNTFVHDNKTDHPLDVILKPNEILNGASMVA